MKEWEKYELIKSDIFDHLLFMSQFQLEIFEEPTGRDFRNLVDTPHQKLMSPFVLPILYKQTSL
jgi:miniconductance mechanosensitive channel